MTAIVSTHRQSHIFPRINFYVLNSGHVTSSQ